MAISTPRQFSQEESQNHIINGNFDYWQRTTSIPTLTQFAGNFACDRTWDYYGMDGGSGVSVGVSQEVFSPGQIEVPGNPIYYHRTTINAIGTSLGVNSERTTIHRVEDVKALSGKTVTLSFYARSSIASKLINLTAYQNFGSGGSANVYHTGKQITLTSSWAKYTYTVVVPSVSGKTIGANNFFQVAFSDQAGSGIAGSFGLTAIGFQGTGTVDIARLMLNIGSEAAPFKLHSSSLAQELVTCRRYYFNTASGQFGYSGQIINANAVYINYRLAVQMRAIPTVSGTSGLYGINSSGNFLSTTQVPVSVLASINSGIISISGFTGLTANTPCQMTVDSTGYFTFDAEL